MMTTLRRTHKADASAERTRAKIDEARDRLTARASADGYDDIEKWARNEWGLLDVGVEDLLLVCPHLEEEVEAKIEEYINKPNWKKR